MGTNRAGLIMFHWIGDAVESQRCNHESKSLSNQPTATHNRIVNTMSET